MNALAKQFPAQKKEKSQEEGAEGGCGRSQAETSFHVSRTTTDRRAYQWLL